MDHHPLLMQRVTVEASFFGALQHLSALYGFQPKHTRDLPYPLNIVRAFEHARYAVHCQRDDRELIICATEDGRVTLATAEPFDTGWSLYYIPVKPIYDLLHQGKEQAALLLTSVCAYLSQVVAVPSFTRDYLSCAYESVREWMADNEESAADAQCIAEWALLDQEGEKMMAELGRPLHLQMLKERVAAFATAAGPHDTLLGIAEEALGLYMDYPAQSVTELLLTREENEEEEPYVISIDQYFSFWWTGSGIVADNVESYLEGSLQEYSGVDQPLGFQQFSNRQESIVHDHQFCTRLFALVSHLCTYLYAFK